MFFPSLSVPNSLLVIASKVQNRSLQDLERLVDFRLVDDQRRCQTNRIAMCRLGQQTVFLQLQAHLPGVMLCFNVK